ncbi:CvpA family protein [Brackiella oedipodis]|uniref:CvpA family protein n=1 Tax=Brackiella oedipodis TaxID=124225 RepID=UPI0004915E36|nr:CvpA family protein [Brackiella oedipodis]
MTIFDFIVLGIIAASGLLGLFRGFFKEVISLVAFILSFMGALRWGPWLMPSLGQWLTHPLVNMAVSYVVVFFVVLLVIGLVNRLLATFLKATGLTPADKGLGFFFGIMRGVIIVLILVMIAGFTHLPQEPWWQTAQFSPMAVDAVQFIKAQLPAPLASYLPY